MLIELNERDKGVLQELLKRVDLKGNEAVVFVQLLQKLNKEVKLPDQEVEQPAKDSTTSTVSPV